MCVVGVGALLLQGPLAGGVFLGGPLPLIAPPPSPFASQRRRIWLQSPDSHSREGVCPAWEGCPGPVMGEDRPTVREGRLQLLLQG